jgi:6-pyruvoyltetrahydropterin/6-carboxytetrahydropterin synthase
MRITRRLEFDAGHRIPNHQSRCRHLHGHRYALEVTLSGEMIATPGASEQGMVMDFSRVNEIARLALVDDWDHAFLAWREDRPVLALLETLPGHRTVIFEAPPTAEHLALAAFRILDVAYRDEYGNNLRLETIRLYETPNCWAEIDRATARCA